MEASMLPPRTRTARLQTPDLATSALLPTTWHTDGGWKGEFKTISVQHNKDFMRYGGKFHCKIISIAPKDTSKMYSTEKEYFKNGLRVHRMHLLAPEHQKCICTCDNHPTSCYRKNFRIENRDYIHGNIHSGVESQDACSNMCSKHPDCTAWEYDSNLKCILKSGQGNVTYAQNDDVALITYAGLNSAVTGCVRPKVDCPMGKYKYVDGVTEEHFCAMCPAGTMTDGINRMGVESCTEARRPLSWE